MFLLALLPLAGWAQAHLVVEWKSGLTTEIVHPGTQPAFQDLINVYSSATSQVCLYQDGYTWANAGQNGPTMGSYSYCNHYNYSVHTTASAAASATSPAYTGDLVKGTTYYLRVWGRFQVTVENNNAQGYQVLEFKAGTKTTVSGLSLASPLYYNDGNPVTLITGTPTLPADYDLAHGGVEYIVKTNDLLPAATDVATGDPEATDAGTYYVFCRAKDDGDLYMTGDWQQVGTTGVKINKAPFKATAVGFTAPAPLATVATFTGNAQKLFTDGVAPTGGAITYSLTSGGTFVAGDNNAVKVTHVADAKKLYYKVSESDNYLESGELSIDLAMNKATYNVSEPTIGTFTYTGAKQGPLATPDDVVILSLAGAPGSPWYAGSGRIEYSITQTTTSWVTNPNNETLKRTDAGTYTIHYRTTDIAANADFEPITDGELVFTIDKADWKTVTDPTLATAWTYDGDEHDLITAPASAEGVIAADVAPATAFKYYLDDTETALADIKALNAKEAGYKVSYEIVETKNYNAVAKKDFAPIVVSRATLHMGAQGQNVVYASPEYDALTWKSFIKLDENEIPKGAKVESADWIKENLVTFTSFEGTELDGGHPKALPTDVDEYDFVLKANDASSNYKLVDFIPNGTLIITKADGVAAGITANDRVFDNTEKPLVTSDAAEVGGTMKYYLTEDKDEAAPATDSGKWLNDIPVATDAGKYYVWSYLKGDDNHKDTDPAVQTMVEITAATPVISAITGIADSWTYGTAAIAPVATVDPTFVGDITFTYAVQGSTEFGKYEDIVNDQVGKYTVKASVPADENGNWVAAADVTKNFEITKADLTVTIADDSKVYGAADPTSFAYTAEKFQFEDNAGTIDLVIARAAGEDVDTYEINATYDSDKAKNYNITINKGTFTITAAELAIEIDDQTKVYGQDDPDFTASFAGLTNGDEPDDIALSYSREAGQDVGEYVISATATGAAASNYTITFTTGKLTITKAALTLKAKADSKVYGEADPELELAEKPAYKNGDDATAIGLTITREKGEDVGTYTITPAATSTNYEYEIVEADFEITPATLVYTLGNYEYPYTGEAYEPVQGETFAKTDGKFFFEDAYGTTFTFAWPDEAEVKDAKTYTFNKLDVNWADGQAENYYIIFSKDAVVTVTPAEIVFTPAEAVEDLTYENGNSQKLVTPATATFTDFEGNETTFDIQYYLDGEKIEKVNELPEAEDAGTYKVTYEVIDETGNFVLPETEEIEVTIAPAEWDLNVAEIAALQAEEAIVYDGTDKFNLDLEKLTVKNGEIALTADDYDLAVTFKKDAEAEAAPATKFFNAGIYTFTFTGKGNYADEDNVEAYDVEILKADFTVTAPVAATDLEYEKDDLDLIATPAVATVAKTDAFEPVVLYSLTGEEDSFDAALPKAMNAGDYDVYYMVKGDDNHNDFSASIVKFANIAKAELIANVPAAKKTYDGTNVVENKEFGEFTYSGLLGGDHVDLGTATISDFVEIPEDAINVGEYAIMIPSENLALFPEQENYYVGSAVAGTLTIEPAAPVTIAFTAAAKYSKEYASEDALEVVAADLMVASGELFDEMADVAKELTISREEGEDVGTYDVMLALGEKAEFQKNYKEVVFAVGADKFEITPFATELKVSIASTARNYNGEVAAYDWAEDLSNMVVTNLPAGKEKSEIFTKLPTVTVVDADKNVGEYNLKLEGGESKNYKFKLLPGSYFAIDPVIVNAVFNSIPVAAVGVAGADILAQVDWAVEAEDEADAEVLAKNEGLFELTFAEGVLDADKKIATEDGKNALVIIYKGEEDPANFLFAADPYANLNIGGEGAEVALDDSGEIITYASEGATVTFTESRAVAKNVWQACVLPFDVTPAQFSDAFGYAAIDVFDQSRTNADEVHFSLMVTGTIEAGTPFLFKTDNDRNFAKTEDEPGVKFEDVDLVATEGLNTTVEDDDTDIKFIGTFVQVPVWGQQFRYLSKGTWYNAGNYTEAKPANIKPLRAYLNMGENAGARIFIEEPDGTTSIMSVKEFNEGMNEGWYTIDGMKLNAAPTQKGVYINNGKKVVVK